MIDPADRHTQPLPLDKQPAKRKRGRPATGQALSNAERQRAYRERQKAALGNVTANQPIDGALAVMLTSPERTAIVCMLQDQARYMSSRALLGGPVTPDELKSARWLSDLAHRIALVGKPG